MKRIIFSILLVLIIPSICFASQSCYKLNDNYVAVKTRIFNDLATSRKLVDVYQGQVELLETNLKELESLDKQKTDAYEKKITNMQLQIDAKQAVIDTQNDSIKQYKQLELIANSNNNKIKKMQRMNVAEKLFIAGLATAAAITCNDTGSAIGFGAAGLLGCCINW